MRSIALLVDDTNIKRLLRRLLAPTYKLMRGRTKDLLPKRPFDVAVVDVSSLNRLREQIEVCKEDLIPIPLPVLLVATSRELDDPCYQAVRGCFDEIILWPLDERVLEIRLESLFQSKEQAIQIERSYHALSKTSLAGVIIFQGRHIAFANESLAEMSGYSLDELLQLSPNSARRLVHPEDRLAALRRMHKIYRGHEPPLPMQFRFLRKDGSSRWVEMLVSRIQYHGRSALQGTAIDISERKEALEAVRQRELALQKAQEVSHVGSWVWDIQSNHLEWSDEMYRIFGIEKDKFSGELTDVIKSGVHPDDQEAVNLSNRSVIEHKKPIPLEYRVIRPDGSIRTVWAEAGELILDDHGKPTKLTGIVQDITERKQVEEALKLSQERLALLYNSMREALSVHKLVYDDSGRSINYVILDVNPMYEEVMGLDRDLVIGRLATDVYQVAKPPYLGRYTKVTHTGIPTQFEAYYEPTDRHFQISAFCPAKDQFATVFTDISDRKQMEEELRESQRLLKTLMDNLPGMAYRSLNHPDWPKEIVSLGCLDLTGYSPDELLQNGKVKFGELIHPDDRAMVWDEVQKALHRKRVFRLLYRIITAEQQLKWVWEQGQGIFDEDGQVVAIEGFITDITERILAEQAVRQSEERYRTLSETTPDIIIVHEPGGRISYINQAGCDFLGLSRDEIYQHRTEEFIPDHYRDDIQTRKARRMRGNVGSFQYEIELMNVKGETLPVDVRSTPIFQKGEIKGILVVARDNTERILAEQAVRQSEERYRTLAETTPDIILLHDTEGRVIYINQAGCDFIGLSREEIYQHLADDFIPAGYEEDISERKAHRMAGNIGTFQYELELMNVQGERLPVDVRSTPITQHDEVIGILVVARDNTERKQAEVVKERLTKQIQDQASELEQILATVPAGVILLDGEGVIQQANPVGERALIILANAQVGDRLTRLGPRPLHELLNPPPEGLWHEIEASNQVFEVVARPMEEGGTDGYWVLVINDVTRDREIRRQLQQQGQLAAVGQLAAGIAHDFNNIIAIIGLYAELGLNTDGLDHKIAERFEMIEQQADRAARLTQQIMDFSRSSVLKRHPIDLCDFFDEFGELIEQTLPGNIKLRINNRAEICTVNADIGRLQQALLNLVLNARDAMRSNERGLLEMDLAVVQLSEPISCVTCGQISSGDWIRIRVRDNGSGIEPAILTHIFEPFFTTKDIGQGTGLGLAQVYGIVKQHGGHIYVESELGSGTTFSIYLPLTAIDPVVLESQESGRIFGRGETILVVEDSPVLRRALCETLELLHYQIVEAENGQEALERLETNPEIALVLSDLVMPDMGGQTMFMEMQRRQIPTPVVMLSGHPSESEMARLQLEGLAGWLQKPPTPDQLAGIIAQALRSSASTEDQ